MRLRLRFELNSKACSVQTLNFARIESEYCLSYAYLKSDVGNLKFKMNF